jgi:hypothetical protein
MKTSKPASKNSVNLFDRLVNAVVRPQVSDGGRIVFARESARVLASCGLLSLYS